MLRWISGRQSRYEWPGIQVSLQEVDGREQYLTPTYKLMLKFQTLDSFLKEQLRISKRNYRQSQANITVAGIIQSEGKE